MVSRGTSQQSSAPFNRRIVLDVIRRAGSVSRKEIVDAVSLSPQTVANITHDLESIGLVVSRRLKEKVRGQPPIAFELNPHGGSSIGISLEPGGLSAALVNLVGDVIKKREVDLDTRNQRKVLASMVSIVKDLGSRRVAGERLWGVGVALPGPLVLTDISFVGPTALEGWTDLSILDELRGVTGLHVYYSVDSVAGALGESLFGVAKGLDTFFYMHFGVGLGGTLVVNRSAYKGASGNATEIGHIPVVANGKACYCGNRGCLERYLSLHSLAEDLGIPEVHDRGKEVLARMLGGERSEASRLVPAGRRTPPKRRVHRREYPRPRDHRDRRLRAQGPGRACCADGTTAEPFRARRTRPSHGTYRAVGTAGGQLDTRGRRAPDP
jgi:predicted NBD/HSP70 family sugar kinase